MTPFSIIQRAIPYPLLLVFSYQHQILLCVADKRKSKADKEKITIDSEQNTHWIDLNQLTNNEQVFLQSCRCQIFSYNNFYQFYNDLCSRITALRCAEQSGYYQLRNNDDRRETLTKIHQLQTRQSELKSTLRNESRFSEKVSLNVQIKQLNQTIETIIQTL